MLWLWVFSWKKIYTVFDVEIEKCQNTEKSVSPWKPNCLHPSDFFRVLVIDTSRFGHYSLQKWGKSWDSKFIVCQELCSWFGVNWFEAKGIWQGGQFQIRALSRLAGLIRFDWLQIFESLGILWVASHQGLVFGCWLDEIWLVLIWEVWVGFW